MDWHDGSQTGEVGIPPLDELDIHCHCGTIGAVFDFFAGTMERAPLWWQEHSLEWLYRLLKEPKRMWRRYIIGNTLFIWNIFREM